MGFSTPAFAETTECTEITSIPTVITQQGVYCFKQSLATNISSGSAISIQANNVTIDFNGFKMGGLGAGPGTTANGVFADNQKNITLRNGNIRGFFYGISLQNGSGHVVVNNILDGNTLGGISSGGEGSEIRQNRVIGTGGSTANSRATAYAISVLGIGSTVLDNEVYGTFINSGTYAFGILNYADAVVIKGNRIKNTSSGSGDSSFGIYSSGSYVSLSGNIIINPFETGDYGIRVGTSAVENFCTKNTVLGFIAQNTSCTDGGGNSFTP